MTNFTSASSATESVAVATPSQGSDGNTVAAIQALAAAVASLQQVSQSRSLAAQPVPPAAVASPANPAPAALIAVAPATAPGFLTRGPWVSNSLYQVIPTGHLTLIAEAPGEDMPLWYCITAGRYVGVTLSHALASGAVVGVSRCAMKSYKTQVLAVESFNQLLDYNMVAVIA
ncbi:hypothetical protein C8R44DRAFT_734106 [Mycena epipterygia]|nr:hypothetical protein C8R44DRAFT_734106 [Mycena epipterygia]